MKKGKFIIISGPSGVGKGTICNVLLKELNAWYSVSMTTRGARDGEVDGVNYYFISKEEFIKRIEEGKLLEYNIYNDNYYGTPKDMVLEKLNDGINVFLEIDVNGARNIKNIFPDALLIYVAPPSIDVLRERLINRGTEDLQTIENRLKIASNELKQIDFYDYVVVNDDLEKAISKVRSIILNELDQLYLCSNGDGCEKLYEIIPVDMWKVIAERVQKLDIYDGTDEEFNYNLVILGTLLIDLDISLKFLSRYPGRKEEIGLASLLQGIYSSDVHIDYKKANFYEKIYQLSELGISSICI